MSGSSIGKHATKHYKTHKLTSILLALLVPFLLCGLICALQGGYEGFISWMSAPLGALTLLGFITVGIHHSRTSMSEVIMDYASSEASASFFLKLSTLACFLFWALGTASILKIWLKLGMGS